MKWLILAPFLLQSALMFVDEFIFHRSRGLSTWERVGHPIDTLSVLAIYLLAYTIDPSPTGFAIGGGLTVFSMILVTKDEAYHQRECSVAEQRCHGLLFGLHPLHFITVLCLWPLLRSDHLVGALAPLENLRGVESALPIMLALTAGAFFHQVFYWNVLMREKPHAGGHQ